MRVQRSFVRISMLLGVLTALLLLANAGAAWRLVTDNAVETIPEDALQRDLGAITIADVSAGNAQQRVHLLVLSMHEFSCWVWRLKWRFADAHSLIFFFSIGCQVSCQYGRVTVSPQAELQLGTATASFVCDALEEANGPDGAKIAMSTTLYNARVILSSLVYAPPSLTRALDVCSNDPNVIEQDTLMVQIEAVDPSSSVSDNVCYDPSSWSLAAALFTSAATTLEKRILISPRSSTTRGRVRIEAAANGSTQSGTCSALPMVQIELIDHAVADNRRINVTLSAHHGSLQLRVDMALRNRVRVYGVELDPMTPPQRKAAFTLRGFASDLNVFFTTVQYCSYASAVTPMLASYFSSDVIDVNATVMGFCSTDNVERSYAALPIDIAQTVDLGSIAFPRNPANVVVLTSNTLSTLVNGKYSPGNVDKVAISMDLTQKEDGVFIGLDDPSKLLALNHDDGEFVSYFQTITRVDADPGSVQDNPAVVHLQSTHNSWLKKRDIALHVQFTEPELGRVISDLTGISSRVNCQQQVLDPTSPSATVCVIEYSDINLLHIPKVSLSNPDRTFGLTMSSLTMTKVQKTSLLPSCGLHVDFKGSDMSTLTFQFTRKVCELAQLCRLETSRMFSSSNWEDELVQAIVSLAIDGEDTSRVRAMLQSDASSQFAFILSNLPCTLVFAVEVVNDAKVMKTVRVLSQRLQLEGPAQQVSTALSSLQVYSLAFGSRVHTSLCITAYQAESSADRNDNNQSYNVSATMEIIALPNLRNIKLNVPSQLVLNDNRSETTLASISVELPWVPQLWMHDDSSGDTGGASTDELFRWSILSTHLQFRYDPHAPSLANVVSNQQLGSELAMRGPIANFHASMAAVSLYRGSALLHDRSFFRPTLARQMFQLSLVPRTRRSIVQTLSTSSAEVAIAGAFSLGVDIPDGLLFGVTHATLKGVTCQSVDIQQNDPVDTIAFKVKTMPCVLPADSHALFRREVQVVRVRAMFPAQLADISGAFTLAFQGTMSSQIPVTLTSSAAMHVKVLEVIPDPRIEVSRAEFPNDNAFEWRITFGANGRAPALIQATSASTATISPSFTISTAIVQSGLQASDVILAHLYPSISLRVRDTKLAGSIALSFTFHFWDVAPRFPYLKLVTTSLVSATTQVPLHVKISLADDKIDERDNAAIARSVGPSGRFRIRIQGRSTAYVPVNVDAIRLEAAIRELKIDELSITVQKNAVTSSNRLTNKLYEWALEASYPSQLTISVDDDELQSPDLSVDVTRVSTGVETMVGYDNLAVAISTLDRKTRIVDQIVRVRVETTDIHLTVSLPVPHVTVERNASHVVVDGTILDGFDVEATLEIECSKRGHVSLVPKTKRGLHHETIVIAPANASKVVLQGALLELNRVLEQSYLMYSVRFSSQRSAYDDEITFSLRSATATTSQAIPVTVLAPLDAPMLQLPTTQITVHEAHEFEIRGLKLDDGVRPDDFEYNLMHSSKQRRVRVHVHARVGYVTASRHSSGNGWGDEADRPKNWRSIWKHDVNISGSMSGVNAALRQLRYVAVDLSHNTTKDELTFTILAMEDDDDDDARGEADSTASKVFHMRVQLTKRPATLHLMINGRLLGDRDQLVVSQDEAVPLSNFSIQIDGIPLSDSGTRDQLRLDLSISAVHGTLALLNVSNKATQWEDLRTTPWEFCVAAPLSHLNWVFKALEYIPKRNFNGPDELMFRVKQTTTIPAPIQTVLEETMTLVPVFVYPVHCLPRWSWASTGSNIITHQVSSSKPFTLPAFVLHEYDHADEADDLASSLPVANFFENQIVLRATVRAVAGTLVHNTVLAQQVTNAESEKGGSFVTLEGKITDLRATLSQVQYQVSPSLQPFSQANDTVTITLEDISPRQHQFHSNKLSREVIAILQLEIDTYSMAELTTFSILKKDEITINEDEDVYIGDSFDFSAFKNSPVDLEFELYALHGSVYLSAAVDTNSSASSDTKMQTSIEAPLKVEATDGKSLQRLVSQLFYTPNADFYGLDFILCRLHGSESELVVRIRPVNDEPILKITQNPTRPWFRHPKLLLPEIEVHDPDADDIFEVRVDATNGSLRWYQTPEELFDGITMSGVDTTRLHLKTTLKRLNALLAQPGLRFVPNNDLARGPLSTSHDQGSSLVDSGAIRICVHDGTATTCEELVFPVQPFYTIRIPLLSSTPKGETLKRARGKPLQLSDMLHVRREYGEHDGDEEGGAVMLQIDMSSGYVVIADSDDIQACADSYETRSELIPGGITRIIRASSVECLRSIFSSAVYASSSSDSAESVHMHFQLFDSDLELLATANLRIDLIESIPTSRFVVLENAAYINNGTLAAAPAHPRLASFAVVEIEQVTSNDAGEDDGTTTATLSSDSLLDLNLTCGQCSFYYSKYIPGVSYEFAVQAASTVRFLGHQDGLTQVLQMLEVDLQATSPARSQHDAVWLMLSPYDGDSEKEVMPSHSSHSRAWNDTLVVPIEFTAKNIAVEWRVADAHLLYTDLEVDTAVPIHGVELKSGGRLQDDESMQLTILVECMRGVSSLSFTAAQRTRYQRCAQLEAPVAIHTTRKHANRVLASIHITPNASEQVDLQYSVEVEGGHDGVIRISAPLLSVYFRLRNVDPVLVLTHPDNMWHGVEDETIVLSDWIVLRKKGYSQAHENGDGEHDGDVFVVQLNVEHGMLAIPSHVCCVGVQTTHGQNGIVVMGTIATLQHALNTLEYSSDLNFAGNDTLHVVMVKSSDDEAVTSTSVPPSSLASGPVHVPIVVQPQNDPPVIHHERPSPALINSKFSLESVRITDVDLVTNAELSSIMRINISSQTGFFAIDTIALDRVNLLETTLWNESTGEFSRIVFQAPLADANFLFQKTLFSSNGKDVSSCVSGSNGLQISTNDLGHGVMGWPALETSVTIRGFGCEDDHLRLAAVQLSLPTEHVFYDPIERQIAIAGPAILGVESFASRSTPDLLRITGRCQFAINLEVQNVTIVAPRPHQQWLLSIWTPNSGAALLAGTFTLTLDLAFAGLAPAQRTATIYADAVAMQTQEVLGETNNGRAIAESTEAKLLALYDGLASPQLKFHVDKVVAPSVASLSTRPAVQWKISILHSPIMLPAPAVSTLNLVNAGSGTSVTMDSSVLGVPLGGSFRLQLGDEVTRELAFDASDMDMQDALEALHGVEIVHITKPDVYTWIVTFFSPGENLPLLRGDAQNLVPGIQKSDTADEVVLRNGTQIHVARLSTGKGQGSVFNVIVGATRVNPVYRVVTSADTSITGTFTLGFQNSQNVNPLQFLATTRAISSNAVAMAEDEGVFQSFGGRLGDSMQIALTSSLDELRRQVWQWNDVRVRVTRGLPDARGGYTWAITFVNAPPDFPKLVVVDSQKLSGTNAVVRLTQTVASNQATGTFQLRYRSLMTDPIAADSSSDRIETALNAILSQGRYSSTSSYLGQVVVRKARLDGPTRSGFSYAVLFTAEVSSSMKLSSDSNELSLVADASQLLGIGAFANVEDVHARTSTGSFELLAMNSLAMRWSGNIVAQLLPDAFVLEGPDETLAPAITSLVYHVPQHRDGIIQFRFDLELIPQTLNANDRDNVTRAATARVEYLSHAMTSKVHLEPQRTPSANIVQLRKAVIVEATGGVPLRLNEFVIHAPGTSRAAWFHLTLSCELGELSVAGNRSELARPTRRQSTWINGTLTLIHTQLNNTVYIGSREASALDRLTLSLFFQGTKVSENMFLVRVQPPPVIPQVHIANSVEGPFTSTNWQVMDMEITHGDIVVISGIWIDIASSVSLSSSFRDEITLELQSEYGTLVFAYFDDYELAEASSTTLTSGHNSEDISGGSRLSLTAPLALLNQALKQLQYLCGSTYQEHDTLQIEARNGNTDAPFVHARTIRLWIHPKVVVPQVILGSATYYTGYEDTGFQFPDLSLAIPDKLSTQDNATTISVSSSSRHYYQLWSSELLVPEKKYLYPRAGNDDWRHRWIMDFPVGGIAFFCEFGKYFYFQGKDSIHGKELWVSDGSKAGTRMLTDLVPGPESSAPTDMVAMNGKLYFAASGLDLSWALTQGGDDEVCPNGARNSSTHPNMLYVVAKSNMWDPSATYDCPAGYHWASTEEGSRYFPAVDPKSPSNLTEPYVFWSTCQWSGYTFGGVQRKYFRFTDSRVTGAMKHAGRRDSAPVEVSFATTDFAGIVCLRGNRSSLDGLGRELWATDGTKYNVVRVADIWQGHGNSNPKYLTLFKSQTLLFQADTRDFGVELFKTDGTAAGTVLVEDIWRGPRSSNPTFFAEWTAGDGRMYFAATSDSGRELWATDGFSSFTAERTRKTSGALFTGTTMVRDVCAGAGSSDPRFLTPTSLGVFFAADDCLNGRELWLTDGTATGTRLVKDLNPTAGEGSNPSFLAWFSSKLYFQAQVATMTGFELYTSDGTASGTLLLADLAPGPLSASPSYLSNLVARDSLDAVVSSALYFGALDNDGKLNLWKSDGTKSGTVPLLDPLFLYQRKLRLDASTSRSGVIFTYKNAMYYLIEASSQITNSATEIATSASLSYQLHVRVNVGRINSILESGNASLLAPASYINATGSFTALSQVLSGMVYYPPPNWNYETGAGHGHVVEWLFSVARGDIVHETYADVVIVPRPDSPVIQVPSWVEHPNWSMGDFLSKFRSSCNPIVCDEDSPVLLRGLTVRSADSGHTPSAKSQALFRVSLSVSHGVLTFADKRCITRLFDSSIAALQRRFEFEADVGCINVVLAASSYTGDPNFSGSDTLNVEVVNVETTLSDQVAVPITVLEINDAPYLVSSEFYDCDEDIPLIIQNIRVVDPDLPVSDTITIDIRAAFGSLALLHSSGVTVTPKSSAPAGFVMQGTLQNINTALASLVYTSGNDWNSIDSTFNSESDGFDTITFQLSDSQSFNSSTTSIRYMYVRPRADPVVISVPQNLPTSDHTDERQGSIHGGEDAWIQVHDLSFASVDDMVKITLQISLSATSGVLELFTTSGITFLDETHNKRKLLTFKGTFANVNRSVSALRYLPDPNFYGVDRIAITAATVDEYTREESQETTATIHVRIDAVNDPPVWDVSSADNVVVEPKSPTLIRGVHFEDVDITNAVCTATELCIMDLVIEFSHGRLSLPRLFEELDPSVQVILQKPGYIALEGSPDHLNFVLHDMVLEFEDIEATQQAFLDLNDIGLTLTVDDRGTFGIGGPRVSTTTIFLHLASGTTRGLSMIAPANKVLLMDEDTAYVFRDAILKIHDADIVASTTASLLEMTVSSPHGAFSLQSVPGIQYVRNDSGTLVCRGFLAQINAALNSSAYIPIRDWYGSERVTFSVVDTSRPSLRTASAVVFLAVASVCDEPSWRSTRSNVSEAFALLQEGEKLLISSLSLAIPDADADNREVTVSIAVNHGGVMLATYQGLLLIETQFNTPEQRFLSPLMQENAITESRLFFSKLEFRGRLYDVNTALIGMIYEPNLHFHSNGNLVEEIVLTATSGCGKQEVQSTASFAVRLRIEAVNDPPFLLSKSFTLVPSRQDSVERILERLPSEQILEATEDVDLILDPISVQDPDQNPNSAFESDPQMVVNVSCVHCSIRPSMSLLTLRESHGLFITPTTTSVTTTTGTRKDVHQVLVQGFQSTINTAFLSSLIFRSAFNFYGTAVILIQIFDLGNFGKGGEKTTTYAQAIVVKKVNDGPEIYIPPYGTLEPLAQLNEDSMVLLRGAPSLQELSSSADSKSSGTTTKKWNLMLAEPFAPESTSLLRSLAEFPGSDFSAASYFAQLQNKILFRGRTPQTGDELWQSDGTAAGTTLLKDIYPGGQGSKPSFLTVYSVDNRVYFAAQGPDVSWRIPDEHQDSCQSFRHSAFDSRVFFAVSESNTWDPDQIYDCPLGYHWMTTAEASAIFIGSVASDGHDNEPAAYFDQCGWDGYTWGGVTRMYFRFSDSRITGAFKHAGYRDSYRLDTGFQTDSFAGILCYHDQHDHDRIWGPELWVTNGSSRGTRRAARINSSGQGSSPKYFTEYKNLLYFQATSFDFGAELWMTDGSRAGTLLVADIEPGIRSSEPKFLSTFGGLLFFSASTSAAGREPWFSDGVRRTDNIDNHSHVGTGILRDICAGPKSSNPKYFTELGTSAVLLFQADDCVKGAELWRTDGTFAGTRLVADLNAGSTGSYPSYLTFYSGKVFFQANDGIRGTELWSTDGTAAGTLLLVDLAPGISSSKPSFLTVLSLGQSSQLVFAAQAEHDRQWEFWQSDGTLSGTIKVFSGSREVVYINTDAMNAMATPRFLSLSSKSFFYFGKQTADQVGTNAALSQGSDSTRSITLFDIESSTRDADRGFILHLNCSKGYLSLNRSCNELTFVRGNQSESVSMTVQGSLRSLNCAVEKVTYHAKPDASGWDDIFITLEERSDKELLGDDGRLYSTTKRIPIEIRSINDAPIIQMPQTYFALHNAWVQLANIAISDADAGDGLVYIQLKVHNGILRVGRSAERIVHLGKTPDTVDAVGSNLEFAATISDAALVFENLEYKCSIQMGCRDGMRDYLTIYVDDNGFTGSGGAQLSTNSAVIQIQSGA